MDGMKLKPLLFMPTLMLLIFCLYPLMNVQAQEIIKHKPKASSIEMGVRPFYLINDLSDQKLKKELKKCKKKPFKKTDFSIGHRGAPLQFPEHTLESYVAAAQQGAGIMECDVTFTKDRELVCRHSQCDLHTTTNILAIPELASKCSIPFTPADPRTGTPAVAKCCTSDITLSEFKKLTGKMDAANRHATTVEEYLDGTPSWRTDLYSGKGTLLTHAESIQLFKKLKVKFTPELKAASVKMPFQGDFSQERYAQKMIDEYKAAGISPRKVYAQSFNYNDILYWIEKEPSFAKNAVFLDARPYEEEGFMPTLYDFESRKAQGLYIIAPPTFALVTLDSRNNIIPSEYAMLAKASDLEIITWTLERSGLLKDGGGFYYQSVTDTIQRDGDTYRLLDVLGRKIGVKGVFSDWPATVTYYANCFGL